MLIQHSVPLPTNAYRLYEQTMLVRRVRKASNEGLSMDWLMPYMTEVSSSRTILFERLTCDRNVYCFFWLVAAQRNRC